MELHVTTVTAAETKCSYIIESDGSRLFWWGFWWGPFWVKPRSTIIKSRTLWQQEVTHTVTDQNLLRNGGRRKQAKEVTLNLETETWRAEITAISAKTLPTRITLPLATSRMHRIQIQMPTQWRVHYKEVLEGLKSRHLVSFCGHQRWYLVWGWTWKEFWFV